MCLRRKRCIVDLRCVEIKIVGKKQQQQRRRVVGSCSSSPPSTLDGTGNTRVLSLDWREVFLQVTNLNTDAPHTLFFFFFCTPPTLTAPE